MCVVCVDVNMRVGAEFQATIPEFIPSKRRFTVLIEQCFFPVSEALKVKQRLLGDD